MSSYVGRSADFSDDLLWVDCDDVALPFQFGGASQKGRLQKHTNNQDSLALWSRGTCVVGVVCDGCGSSVKGNANTELGARFLSIAVTDIVGQAAAKSGVASLDWGQIEHEICAKIAAVTSTLARTSKEDDVLHNLMMSTILGFVVDEAVYVVFGCGDGLFVLNGVGSSLDSKHGGKYLAENLLAGADWKDKLSAGDRSLVLHRTGPTGELNHLLIGSDGVEDLQDRFGKRLAEFIANGESEPTQTGFCESVARDFRALVWRSPEVEEWAKSQDGHDDRSFIVMRRTNPKNDDQATPGDAGENVATNN